MEKCKLCSVILHITDMCTSHCPYCYACANDKKYSHADINTIYKIIDELAKAEVERVSLLGGDPVLHPHIIEIAKRLSERGIAAGIMSNTLELPVGIDEAVKYIDVYETTIHGRNALEHDAFSHKPGAYDLLMNNLRTLSKYNVTIGIAINVIPETSEMIYDMVEALIKKEKIRMDYIILQRIISFGRAEDSTRYLLAKENLEKALENVDKVHRQLGIKICVEDPFPLCAMDECYRQYMHPCEWGYTKAALNGSGDLTRCGADPRYLLGNIFEKSIKEIWEYSPILVEFREKKHLPDECKKCKMLAQCGGGCSLSCSSKGADGADYLMDVYGRKSIK